MIHANDLKTLRSSYLTEREALVAAAYLPHLPDDDALVRIRERSEFDGDETTRFKDSVSTISGTRLRRVTIEDEAPEVGDTYAGDEVGLTPAPHGTRTYVVSVPDFHAFRIGDDPDFDETPQACLTDFDFDGPSPIDDIHRTVGGTDDDDYRRPHFPE